MIVHECKEPILALLKYLSIIDSGSCNCGETDQDMISQYIHRLSGIFNSKKAFDYLKNILEDKIQQSQYRDLLKGNDGKTYRNLRADFKKRNDFENYPSRETVIKICFDFNIRDKNRINELFDKLYINRLYLKDKTDCAYYYFLTKTEKTYNEVKAWISENISCESDNIESRRPVKKYTAELYEDLEEMGRENPDELKVYIYNNATMFEKQKYYQFTAKDTIRDTVSKSVDKPVILPYILFDVWADIIAQNKPDEAECLDGAYALKCNILRAFGSFNSNKKYDSSVLIPKFCRSKYFNDICWNNLEKLYAKISASTISRGSYLLLLLARIGYDDYFNDSGEPVDILYARLNNSLEGAGFSPLNYGGIVLDTIICDFADAYFDMPASVVGYGDDRKTISDFICIFMDSLSAGKLDFCFE